MRHTKSIFYALFALASIPSLSFAHGTMEIPVSRALSCYNEGAENPKSDACKEAKKIGGSQPAYNWNGISQNVPKGDHQTFVTNGMLCSGGNSFYRGYDLGRSDWTTTAIVPDSRGNFEFVYRATAPHTTEYFKLYITKNGWNKQAALNWSDLEEFASVDGKNYPLPQVTDGRYKMTVKLPKNKTGQHIIYTVWKRNDPVGETFYSCSDVKFAGEDGPPIDPPSNPWKDQGSVTAHDNLPAKSTVTLRVFDTHARDVERHTVALNVTTGLATNWPYELALKVNAQSSSMRIGVIKQNGNQVAIVPEQSATANHIYLNDSYKGYLFSIDIKKENGDVTPPKGDEWKEGVTYQRGQVVSYLGKQYRCLQMHTAWAGANWNPQKEIALWQTL